MAKLRAFIGFVLSAIGIGFLLFGFLMLLAAFSTGDFVFGLIFCGILAVIGIFLIRYGRQLSSKKNAAPTATPAAPATKSVPEVQSGTPVVPTVPAVSSANQSKRSAVPEGEMDYCLFSDVEDNAILMYQYEQNIALSPGAFSLVLGNGGKYVTFHQETNNEYDPNAVAIYLKGEKLGYIYCGKVQDMVNDYIGRGWPVRGYINKYSKTDEKATYKIGFYKPSAQFLSKTYTLVKTKKKIDDDTTRMDNLERCDEGCEVLIEESFDSDRYTVVDIWCGEIGELPIAANKFISENDGKKIIGILESLDTDDEENTKAVVRLCVKD